MIEIHVTDMHKRYQGNILNHATIVKKSKMESGWMGGAGGRVGNQKKVILSVRTI